MQFQDLSWMDVEAYLERDTRILLITGATEQHAYLSLMTDILIPSRIAQVAAEREGVLVAPPLNFGVSGEFVDYPGTITLSPQTFDLVLCEIVEGLMYQGFERFFILNGHGGNRQPQRLKDLQRDNALTLVWYDWWRENAAKSFEAEHSLRLNHANWGENFPFTRLGEMPTESKPNANLELLDGRQTIRDVLGDGNFGGPYQIADELMQALFAQLVEEVTDGLRSLNNIA